MNISDILTEAMRLADEAEVFFIEAEDTSASFEADKLKKVVNRQTNLYALRIVKEGRIGYAISADPQRTSELVTRAVETSQFGVSANFEFPAPSPYPSVPVYDPATEDLPIESMVEAGRYLIDALKSAYPALSCDVSLSKGVTSLSLMNSKGTSGSYKQTTSACAVEGMLVRDTDMLFVGDEESSCNPVTDTSAILQRVLTQLEHATTNATMPSGKVPVIFTPNGVAGALMSPLMSALNGKNVLEGSSPLAGKQGKGVFSSCIWLWDDPMQAFMPESRPFDDEGVPSQRTPLVEAGVVTNFLYDLRTATMAHTKSTGNGSRRGVGLPSPAPSAFIMPNGDTSVEDMISDIESGLIIDFLMGAEQGNILSGDFSGNVLLGYRVENGKIVGRVKDTMVAGNIYQLLNQAVALGNDRRWVGGQVMVPSLMFGSLSVASR